VALAERRLYGGLDGLRGVAALVVLVFHVLALNTGTQQRFFHGYLAVDLFFLLSGFVVAGAYEAKLTAGALSFPAFAGLRLKRLWPMAALGVGVGALCALLVQPSAGVLILKLSCAALTFLPQGGSGDSAPFPIDPVLWSLSVEIVVNLLYAALARRLSTPVLIAVCGAAFAGLVAVGIPHGGLSMGWRASDLAMGYVRAGFSFPLGVLLWRIRDRWPALPFSWRGASVLVLGAALTPYLLPEGPAHGFWDLAAVAILFPLVLMAAAQPAPRAAAVTAALGGISYPLYVLHYPLLLLLASQGRSVPVGMVGAFGCVALSVLVWTRVDAPIQAWFKTRAGQRPPGVVPQPAAVT
jgi:peptidoglycan/LPS O-acetylase OafA/YrhL